MTEMRGAIICVGFWRSPPSPPPQCTPLPDATILLYPNDREMGAPLSFVGFWRPPMLPPPDATILNYLIDIGGGGGGRELPFVKFWRPPITPPPLRSTDAKLLNYLNDREGGGGCAIIFCRILTPLPLPQTPHYLPILMTERGGAIIFYRILAPPMPPSLRH